MTKPNSKAAKPEAVLHGSSTLPSLVAIGAAEVALGDIVRRAFTDSGLAVADWNGLTDAERDARLAATIATLEAEAAAEAARAAEAEAEASRSEEAKPVRLNGNGNGACNVFGVEYVADDKGFFEVPANAVEHLLSHGFTVA